MWQKHHLRQRLSGAIDSGDRRRLGAAKRRLRMQFTRIAQLRMKLELVLAAPIVARCLALRRHRLAAADRKSTVALRAGGPEANAPSVVD